jgi:hypothetical protein
MAVKPIRPFKSVHTFTDPDEALDFFEEQVGGEFPDSVANLLYQVAEEYPDALFNVQPAYATNYVAVAHEGDRRSWMFIRPERLSIWTGHAKVAKVLLGSFGDALKPPANPTRGTRQYVDVSPDDADDEAVLLALRFASEFAEPPTDDEDAD